MAKFKMTELIPEDSVVTARLGTTAGTFLTDTETGKLVVLTADSRYDLVAAGNKIDGRIMGKESATADNWTIGSVQTKGRLTVTCNGLEATHGTGTIAIGDYVVASTPVTLGTALGALAYPKVAKATNQPGVAIVSTVGSADTAAAVKTQLDAVLVKVADAQANLASGWRVVSLLASGAVGDIAIIEKV